MIDKQLVTEIMAGSDQWLLKISIAIVLTLLVTSYIILMILLYRSSNIQGIELVSQLLAMILLTMTCKTNPLSMIIMAVLATITTDEEFIFKLISLFFESHVTTGL